MPHRGARKIALRKKCPNVELFLTSIFSPNRGNYGPEITPYLDTFHTLQIIHQKKVT